ncbi:uncharacterized protein C8R40DRAFT_1137537 [Lentinula edodes]|uniref:uncharacterized protein n=1 Tax=Lentinula edodes TaxID=5353 RepID=UPI001E8D7885|nr:uncharacterized protein C8R40DRAFT_1137537 [Lentinula edodes]KAH7867724.1 hypothetical protein C8R40DRAFT_1137537 [Lentinula edodes]
MSSVDDFNTGSGNEMNANASQQQNATGQQQSEDYGDKGLDAIEKKEGVNLNRNTNEKITDAAREGFEKITGKDVPSKFSN